ncbi:hypothetical protein SUGI_0881200 [Cryptomeria japonica]|nr:hypothetical protein SUGI_0881200 [Cryptomeria japonica]
MASSYFPIYQEERTRTFKDRACKTGLRVLEPAIFQVCKTPGDHRKIISIHEDDYSFRPQIGKDCGTGGTWLISSANGCLTFLTNFREPTSISEAKSRGNLITRFLLSFKTPMDSRHRRRVKTTMDSV